MMLGRVALMIITETTEWGLGPRWGVRGICISEPCYVKCPFLTTSMGSPGDLRTVEIQTPLQVS